jgi:hypothetical protein
MIDADCFWPEQKARAYLYQLRDAEIRARNEHKKKEAKKDE